MQQLLPPGGTLVYTDPTEAFMLYIKIALIAGLMLASPAVLTQLWLFVAPGLYAHEKKWAIPFVADVVVLFRARGGVFTRVVFPITWRFFVGFTTRHRDVHAADRAGILDLSPTAPRVGHYVFQMPTLVLFLARMGMITPRFMIRTSSMRC